jgi:RNA polymerase sigma factor (sigma-70 family)
MFLKLFSRTKTPDDQELVQQYQVTGDLDCIAKLFERHTEMVYLVCFKYLQDEEDSKDATMQVFESIVVALKRHEVHNFKSWLHSIAKNHCLMQLRSQKSRTNHSIESTYNSRMSMVTSELQHTDAEQHEQELQALERGLTDLPEEQRICVELFYLQHKSYREIAEITGCSLNNVKSYIQNGKRNLKNYVEKYHAKR